MPTLAEIEQRASEIAGHRIAISVSFLSGEFGLTDGRRVVTQTPEPPDEAWDLDIDQFATRYLMPMVHGLKAA